MRKFCRISVWLVVWVVGVLLLIILLLLLLYFFPYEDPSSSFFSESFSPAIHLEIGVTATLKAGRCGGPYSGVAPLPLSHGLRK